jgi:hypothetical protein
VELCVASRLDGRNVMLEGTWRAYLWESKNFRAGILEKGQPSVSFLTSEREVKVRRRAGEILDLSPQSFQIGTVALYAYHNEARRFCFGKEGH